MTANSQTKELKPNITRLQALGCQLVRMEDLGAFGYVATFRKEHLMFSVVKDRGSWHLSGEAEELQHSPSRKSRGLVEKDAIAWLESKTRALSTQLVPMTKRRASQTPDPSHSARGSS